MAEVRRYAIVDKATGEVVNIAAWDGEAEWHPGEQFEVREATDADQQELNAKASGAAPPA